MHALCDRCQCDQNTGREFSSGRPGYVLSLTPMTALTLLALCCAVGLSGCATSTVSRGATLLSGLKEYQGEIQSLGDSPSRWPDRQRAGGNLKSIILMTVGASLEFYRLVDLDIKRREFEITLRETHVSAKRTQEMRDELTQMSEEIAALKPVIRTQLASIRLESEEEHGVEEVAVRGLLNLALEQFSSNAGPHGLRAPSTKVGRYLVYDLGSFATVSTPDGQSFRCVVFGVAETGAGINCEPITR